MYLSLHAASLVTTPGLPLASAVSVFLFLSFVTRSNLSIFRDGVLPLGRVVSLGLFGSYPLLVLVVPPIPVLVVGSLLLLLLLVRQASFASHRSFVVPLFIYIPGAFPLFLCSLVFFLLLVLWLVPLSGLSSLSFLCSVHFFFLHYALAVHVRILSLFILSEFQLEEGSW